jgi:eukaryotic-like serine/threonine-protein kinase
MHETTNFTDKHADADSLKAFEDGMLPSPEATWIREHLKSCEQCMRLRDSIASATALPELEADAQHLGLDATPDHTAIQPGAPEMPAVFDPTTLQPEGNGDPWATVVGARALNALNQSPDPSQTIDLPIGVTSVEVEIQSICQRFSSALRSSGHATIEDFLPDHITGVNRSKLVERLVMCEMVVLRETNTPLDRATYLSRFSQFEDAVRSALRRIDNNDYDLAFDSIPTFSADSNAPIRVGGAVPQAATRFHPIRLHAKGGLGAVFLARDAELGRTVALKEIQSKHSLDRSSQDRFVAEAIVTGALEHPGIVPVYGLGRYSDGRPYYAMRFIQGKSFQEAINEFHKSNPVKDVQTYVSREFKSLLRTFIELCSAMYYAHEHGILHRDIKPDNVMLGKFGETMVVDWGLAKVLGRSSNETRQEFDNLALRKLDGETMVGAVLGTPAYMSPEQAKGLLDELTPASDIYSLGATLFTLLTGERPVDGRSSVEVVLNVRKGNIRRIQNIAPKAPLALVSICYKAMHVSPSERYANGGELVEDVERWLADDLVLAHQHLERPLERLGRLVRRYHTWAVAGAIFLTAFTVLSILAVILIERSRSREVIAKLQAQESKAEAIERYQESRTAIDTWLVGSNDALQFYPGTQSLRKRMLQLAVDDYQKLTTSSSRDPDLELERARALIRLGDLHQIQQDYDQALENYQSARTVLESIGDTPSINGFRDAEIANSHARSAVAYFQQDKLEEAESNFKTAVIAFDKLVKQIPDDDQVLLYATSSLVGYSELLIRKGRHQDAIAQLDRCRRLNNLPDDKGRHSKALSLIQVRAGELSGRAYTAIGKYEEANKTLLDALQFFTTKYSEDTDDPDVLDAIASLQISRADVLRVQGLQSETEQCLVSAIEKYRQLLKAMPDVPRYAESLALTLTDLGLANQDDGSSLKAMATLKDAAENWQDLLILYAEVPRYHEQSAACEDAFSQVILDATNDATESLAHASSAVQTYQELVELTPEAPSNRQRLAIARSHAAVCLHRLGRNEDALLVFAAAEEELRSLADQGPESLAYQHALAHVLAHKGTCLFEIEQTSESKSAFQEAISLWTTVASEGHVEAAFDLASILSIGPMTDLRDLDLALQFATKALRAAPKNSRYKAMLAAALALKGDEPQKVEAILNEIKADRGEWTAREFFAQAILKSQTDPDLAKSSLIEGEAWQKANQPGSQFLTRLHGVALERIERP